MSSNTNNKRISIAFIGEGSVHGDDDCIAMRPYSTSLVCSTSESEVIMMTKENF